MRNIIEVVYLGILYFKGFLCLDIFVIVRGMSILGMD
jgi:hypothetical protein